MVLNMEKRAQARRTGLLFMGKCGVFIDAANLSRSAQKFGLTVDYKKLAKFFLSQSSASFLRYYGPTFEAARQRPFFGMLDAKGYRVVTKPVKVIHDKSSMEDIRKANFDVEIAVDAMRLVKTFDVFVLFSGDSDFTYLCKILRKLHKTVVVFSTRWRVSRELVEIADYYVDIKEYEKDFLKKRG